MPPEQRIRLDDRQEVSPRHQRRQCDERVARRIGRFPANDYDLTGEYARADFDRRHRLVIPGRLTARSIADIGVGLTINSPGLYTKLLGQDIFHNGRGRARPAGVARNTLQAAGFASFGLRIARDIPIGSGKNDDHALSVGLDAFSLTNRVNYGSYVGTSDPLCSCSVSARSPR